MSIQRINRDNGEFELDKGFKISNTTTVDELLIYFGESNLKESLYVKGCYISPQIKLERLYFVFSFYVENDTVSKIGFEIETEARPRAPWSNNRDFETNWIAQQIGDTDGFSWDMNQAGRHYHLPFKWGSIGVYYDFKNGTFNSAINYAISN